MRRGGARRGHVGRGGRRAAPARFAGPVRIPATLSEDFALFHDGVLVRAESGRVLRSHRLDGTLRWSVRAPAGQGLPIETAGDVVLVSTPQWPGETVALDRGTGRERWRLDGTLFATVGDLVVLSFGGTGAFPEDDVRYLSAVRAADGQGAGGPGYGSPVCSGR